MYRTDNGGQEWVDISAGLPWRGGFPMVAHPRERDTVFVIPAQHGKEGFMTPRVEGGLRVYRSRDAGQTWVALNGGLPSSGEHHIYRDALTADDGEACGLYFGTKDGFVYASFDQGEQWRAIAGGLPAVRSVRSAAVA